MSTSSPTPEQPGSGRDPAGLPWSERSRRRELRRRVVGASVAGALGLAAVAGAALVWGDDVSHHLGWDCGAGWQPLDAAELDLYEDTQGLAPWADLPEFTEEWGLTTKADGESLPDPMGEPVLGAARAALAPARQAAGVDEWADLPAVSGLTGNSLLLTSGSALPGMQVSGTYVAVALPSGQPIWGATMSSATPRGGTLAGTFVLMGMAEDGSIDILGIDVETGRREACTRLVGDASYWSFLRTVAVGPDAAVVAHAARRGEDDPWTSRLVRVQPGTGRTAWTVDYDCDVVRALLSNDRLVVAGCGPGDAPGEDVHDWIWNRSQTPADDPRQVYVVLDAVTGELVRGAEPSPDTATESLVELTDAGLLLTHTGQLDGDSFATARRDADGDPVITQGLRAVEAATGREVWTVDFGAQKVDDVLVVGDVILTQFYDGHVVATSTTTGAELWQHSGEAPSVAGTDADGTGSDAEDDTRARTLALRHGVVVDGLVLMQSGTTQVTLDPATGRMRAEETPATVRDVTIVGNYAVATFQLATVVTQRQPVQRP